ncbi:protein NRT1/ PTR FAMILY 2.3-like [Dioscorea cayenensis subsp. rotundata]|uniref:Protein NRT1/ PTR FAMILY 2.3-like n=1 Tax=Dioscorea cayennensis subsp. rotundata TaxID=55577 RepID=A0AB40BNX0_DIOCR|nr:protein NRT1/ PTR FAMILY 2.3-like [Dioscorea cayenensis subsp. rotundata]
MASKEQYDQSQSDVAHDHESQTTPKQGGWITFPFIIGNVFGMSLIFSGTMGNFIVFLIKHYNFKSIDAAQLFNIINGSSSFSPLLGAIISDSFFGCLPVITFSTVASLFSMILLTLTAGIKAFRPTNSHCGERCQLALLYTP